VLNPVEADDWRWVSIDGLKKEITENPDAFTPWLKIIIAKYSEKLH
jgi:isopentenyl-diphosphate delta-isomerase